jgi:hypothetical protein
MDGAGTRFVCAGPVCKCGGSGDECDCEQENGGCVKCGRTMILIDAVNGKPIAAAPVDARQGSLL